jgi:NADH-quinone oxidoreductase subunit F
MELVLTKYTGDPEQKKLETYVKRGGYQALKKALAMKPEEVIEEAKKSGIRGRGGAGFPAGMKWSFVPKDSSKPRYVVCNADESEPGTFKDRLLMERDPHAVLEGILIACHAIKSHLAFIYIRGEFVYPAKVLAEAIEEARKGGYIGKKIMGSGFDCDIIVFRGAGAYICGEETGLLESIEGKRGYPRLKPPFPAVEGLYQCPTVINNVETLASMPWIFTHGGEAYARMGTEKSKGTKLWSVSGHVEKPGVYEVEMGYPFDKFLQEHCGGVRKGRKLKALIPGGSSAYVMTARETEGMLLDYESIAQKGSMLGSGGMIVFDETACMVKSISVITDFYAHESCGQCTPCREGSGWAKRVLHRILDGKGEMSDVDLLLDIAFNIDGRTICPMGEAQAWPLKSFVTKFRDEFEQHIKDGGRCALHRG